MEFARKLEAHRENLARAEAAQQAEVRAAQDNFNRQYRALTDVFAEAVAYLQEQGIQGLRVVRSDPVMHMGVVHVYPFTAVRLGSWILHEGDLWRASEHHARISVRRHGIRKGDLVLITPGERDHNIFISPHWSSDGRTSVEAGELVRWISGGYHHNDTYEPLNAAVIVALAEAQVRAHQEGRG